MITPETESFSLIRLLIATTTVIGLIGLFALAMKRLSLGSWNLRKHNKETRLKLVEILPLDARRRLVIFRCDDEEHLALLGNNSDILIKSGIPAESGKKNKNTG